MMVVIDDSSYNEIVEKSQRPVLLDIWAPSSALCRAIEPILEDLKAAFDSRLIIARLNVEEQPELAKRLGIIGLPTIRVFSAGQVTYELTGVPDHVKLMAAVGAAVGALGRRRLA